MLSKEDARTHLHAGTKLRKKGDPPEKWLCGTRTRNQLMVSYPLTKELEDEILSGSLVVAE